MGNEKKSTGPLLRDKLIILAYYISAFALSWFAVTLLPIKNDLIRTLVADVIATIFIYILSLLHDNTSVYDPYWSVYPGFIVLYWYSLYNTGFSSLGLREAVVIGLVFWWGVRLTYNWTKYWG